ncbi:MAG TPA: hypothetical protein VFB08_19505 [Burkholderiales bacterium]|nr:hypothetical protein [Burkholderiales bacterium]
MDKRTLQAIAAVAVALAAALAGYALYARSEARAQHEAIAALVAASTVELKETLSSGASPEKLEAAEDNLQKLRTMNVSRQRALADAAEHYLIAAHTVVRASGEAARLSHEADAARQALATHMAVRRSDAWFGAALKLKERVEKAHFELNLACKALDEVLGAIAEDVQALAPRVGAQALLDEPTRLAARTRAQDDARRAAAELAQARRLVEPR